MQRWERNERSPPTDRSVEGPGHSPCRSGSGSAAWSRTRAGGASRAGDDRAPRSERRSIANCQPDFGPMGSAFRRERARIMTGCEERAAPTGFLSGRATASVGASHNTTNSPGSP